MDSNTLWRIINKYFEDNPNYLVSHHLESYNDFFKKDIFEIFKNKNPIQIVSAEKETDKGVYKHRCNLYLGGRDGRRLYFGKPMIHDGDGDSRGSHYMYPNEARLRNMTYAMTVHYDVEVEFVDILEPGEDPYIVGPEFLPEEEVLKLGGYGGPMDELDVDYSRAFEEEIADKVSNYKIGGGLADELGEQDGGAPKKKTGEAEPLTKRKEKRPVKLTPALSAALNEAQTRSVAGTTQRRVILLNKVYLGKIPIMIQSEFCVLHGMPRELRHTFGECRNDPGGYFIINGKEKTIAVQEKFGDNMLYIRKGRVAKEKGEDAPESDDDYLYSAEIRSVSENVAKPKRTMSVKLMTPTKRLTNKNLMVFIPNVRAPVPLFILFRALGVLSDKDII
jgi:DNA-directed RNA polymerase beta subunit